METLKLLSPAKVNFILNVKGRRPDGYHELEMLMAKISIYDEITLTLKSEGVSLSCDSSLVPLGSENIACRAAAALIDAKGLDVGVHIRLNKKIPMGGGLGGGSSNAAAVLHGLNELTGNSASLDELMEIGLNLGADVPFFLFEGAALAEGIGERLTLVDDLPEVWMILINPEINVPTAEIFTGLNLDLTGSAEKHTIVRFNRDIDGLLSGLHNDLEDVTFKAYPEVREAKDFVCRYGALGALMSGSGSTVFGIYADKRAAELSLVAMEKDLLSRGWTSFLANTL